MNKIIVCLLTLVVMIGCRDRKPFVTHKLEYKKVSDNCSDQQSYFRMTSSFGGERYEFEKCLAQDFNSDQCTSARKGDTVLVLFNKPAPGTATAAYHMTLDIDSYPAYRFLTIDNDTYAITPTEK